MGNQLQIFNHSIFGEIRAIEIDNEVWIVGKDAAIALGYQNPAEALTDHVPAKFKKIITRKQWQQMASNQETSKTLFSESTMGGVQRVTLINEAGLYKLIMRSKLPNAEKFSDWCCGEVLPSVRKNGYYVTQEKIEDIVRNPDRFIEELMSAYKRVKSERDAALSQVALLEPKANYCDNVLISDEHLTSELIAKDYGHSATWLNNELVKLDVWYKRGRRYFLMAKYANLGYRISETVTLDGGKTVTNHYWTQKGREFIYHFLKKYGIVPIRERQALSDTLF